MKSTDATQPWHQWRSLTISGRTSPCPVLSTAHFSYIYCWLECNSSILHQYPSGGQYTLVIKHLGAAHKTYIHSCSHNPSVNLYSFFFFLSPVSELPALVVLVSEYARLRLSGYHELCVSGGRRRGRTFVEWKMASKAPLLTFRSDNI